MACHGACVTFARLIFVLVTSICTVSAETSMPFTDMDFPSTWAIFGQVIGYGILLGVIISVLLICRGVCTCCGLCNCCPSPWKRTAGVVYNTSTVASSANPTSTRNVNVILTTPVVGGSQHPSMQMVQKPVTEMIQPPATQMSQQPIGYPIPDPNQQIHVQPTMPPHNFLAGSQSQLGNYTQYPSQSPLQYPPQYPPQYPLAGYPGNPVVPSAPPAE